MSSKYRVISVQYLDVFASDQYEAMQLANDEYLSMSGEERDAVRTAVIAYDFESGLSNDELLSIGMDIDYDGSVFSPINDPF